MFMCIEKREKEIEAVRKERIQGSVKRRSIHGVNEFDAKIQ